MSTYWFVAIDSSSTLGTNQNLEIRFFADSSTFSKSALLEADEEDLTWVANAIFLPPDFLIWRPPSFFTGCRYHEWALLTVDRLVREPGGVIIAVRLQVKGGSFRDLPLTRELSDSLGGWFAFLESIKGRAAAAGWGSQLRGLGARLSWQERRAV